MLCTLKNKSAHFTFLLGRIVLFGDDLAGLNVPLRSCLRYVLQGDTIQRSCVQQQGSDNNWAKNGRRSVEIVDFMQWWQLYATSGQPRSKRAFCVATVITVEGGAPPAVCWRIRSTGE